MTKEELGQYRALKIEIEMLQKRIDNLEKSRQAVEHGFVKGSNSHFPYEPKSFHVSGYNITADVKKEYKVKQLKIMLEKKKSECEDQLLKIQEYINKLSDSNARIIFTMIFIDGMTQDQVAKKIHLDRSRVSRKMYQYLEVSKVN